VGQKSEPQMLVHNFAKYWPIFKILLQLQSPKNCNAAVTKHPTKAQTRRYTTL